MKKLITRLMLLSMMCLAISCVKEPDLDPIIIPDPDPTPEPPVDTRAKTIGDLQITSFGVLPKYNDHIYIPIQFFTKEGNNYTFNGLHEVRYYKTDLKALKVSFETNASKVTIADVEQKSGVNTNNFSNQLTYRFYALDGNYKEYTVNLSNPEDSYSGLPVLALTVGDGSVITSKEIWKGGRIQIDKQLQNATEYNDSTNIRGRGNSTWGMPKKPYALQLITKDQLMNMTKQKRWALLANYADKTLLRNRIAFEIAKRTNLAWTPDTRFVELIFNGEYQGNYLLTEQIRIDSKRVAIKETDNTATGDDITGGYLIEIDRYNTAEPDFFRLKRSKLPVVVKDPSPMNTDQQQYITDYLNTIEDLLYQSAPDSSKYGQYIDIASFIDYWIVYELTGNRDIRIPGSFYMHKDVNKKLVAGPVWDFDQTTFLGDNDFILANYDPQPGSADYELYGNGSLWFGKLFKDPKFKAKAKERWNQLYQSGKLSSIPSFIDSEAAYIQKSAYINWKPTGLWDLNIGLGQTTGRNHDEELDWKESVEKLKSNYNKRLTRLNSLVNGL